MHLVWIALFLCPLRTSQAHDAGESLTFQNRQLTQEYFIFSTRRGKVLFETAPSDLPKTPFDTILCHGILPDSRVKFEIAIFNPSGAWSPWMAVETKRRRNGRFWGRLKLPSSVLASIKLKAVSEGIKNPHHILLFDVEVFDSRQPATKSGSVYPSQEETLPTQNSPGIVERNEWGAHPPKEAYTPHQPQKLTLHHTAGKQTFDPQESMEEVHFIQEYHMEGRGWNDIAYHFLMDGSGKIYRGRPEDAEGTHIRAGNSGNLGIAFLGYYHPPENNTAQQLQNENFGILAKYLISKYHIAGSTLKGHRDYNATACPGDTLYPLLKDFRDQLDPKP
ncbi:MAG: N-acetylmuramoyl-L-alanine amidase [Elusimicrobia bacterium]|nr:N-acetylmuramoyl-L-alanine amidase [Elusimicrobiota bacterium]